MNLIFKITTFILLLQPSIVKARNIYLNGIDVSSSRQQKLNNVNVVIDERGDVFISAPHYQVQQEETYLPLSSQMQALKKTTPTMINELKNKSETATPAPQTMSNHPTEEIKAPPPPQDAPAVPTSANAENP